MYKSKIQIISDDLWLEILLKQYFKDIEVTTSISKDIADIIIDPNNKSQVNITSASNQNWLLNKPLSVSIFINTIEQALNGLNKNSFIIGSITFYPEQKLCRFENEDIELTQKESEILLYLVEHPKGVDKNTLLNAIWGYSADISTHTLETHIYKLRNKFLGKHELILSKDMGYVLNAS